MRVYLSGSLVASVVLTLFVFAGCQPAMEVQQLKILDSPTPQQLEQKAAAMSAKEKLFSGLLGALTESMSEQGPAKSIKVCKQKAPEIASQVSRETGVRIGRTSFKLRNASNAPPEWAAGFVKEQVEEEILVELTGQRLGVLSPIRLMDKCALCHGFDDQVVPEVKEAIAREYPRDQATGFRVGDIRGYFWMEVNAADSPNAANAKPSSDEG